MISDIDDAAIKKLDSLQIMMFKTILNCPGSTLHAAILWDLGGVKMKYRVIEKKLNLMYHILYLDQSSLAKQIQSIQYDLKLPGLSSECLNFIEDLNLPNIFEVKVKRNKWKNLVKDAILAANEKELREEISESKKLKNSDLANEKFGIKKYVFDLSLHESRTLFKHRAKVTQHVKMNFKMIKHMQENYGNVNVVIWIPRVTCCGVKNTAI